MIGTNIEFENLRAYGATVLKEKAEATLAEYYGRVHYGVSFNWIDKEIGFDRFKDDRLMRERQWFVPATSKEGNVKKVAVALEGQLSAMENEKRFNAVAEAIAGGIGGKWTFCDKGNMFLANYLRAMLRIVGNAPYLHRVFSVVYYSGRMLLADRNRSYFLFKEAAERCLDYMRLIDIDSVESVDALPCEQGTDCAILAVSDDEEFDRMKERAEDLGRKDITAFLIRMKDEKQ